MVLKGIKSVFEVKDIRNKVIATLVLVLVYKFLSVIPVPGVNTDGLAAIMEQQQGLSFFSALMWWGLANFSIILMGLSPYINAVIIMQLLGVIVPKIGDLQKEGEAGQKKITKATRWLTLPLAFVQSYWMIVLLNTLAGGTIIDISDTSTVLMSMVIVTAGTVFLMWLGEVMTEYGIGNGISVLITAWVLSAVPWYVLGYFGSGFSAAFADTSNGITIFGQTFSTWITFFIMLLLTLFVIYVIIKFTEWNRRIPIIYTRTGREEKSYFPIRVNQAGMIPIIFAVSLVTFPAIIGQILSRSSAESSATIGNFLLQHFSLDNPSIIFIIIYFLLVLGFSFFYVSITFNTDQVAENIQKRGGYIPGIRPGSETSEYLAKVSAHLNLFGGGFLALIAISPYVMQKVFQAWSHLDFLVSAAGLIIIVSVILDIVRKVDSEMKMFDYSKFK